MEEVTERYKGLAEKTVSSRTVFSGRVFEAAVKEVILADGSKGSREVIRHNGGACILPVDDEGYCYMIRQFRSPFEKIFLEAPAGKLENGEDPRECAIRELREETGYTADEVIDLGCMVATPGYDNEIIWLYGAKGLKFVGQELDEGEFVNCEKIKFEDLLKMVENGIIADGKTQLCIYKMSGRIKG